MGIHVATQSLGLRGSRNGPVQPATWMCSHCGLGVVGHWSTHHLAWVAFPRMQLHYWVGTGARRAVGQQKKHVHSLPYLAWAGSVLLCPLYPCPVPLSWWLGSFAPSCMEAFPLECRLCAMCYAHCGGHGHGTWLLVALHTCRKYEHAGIPRKLWAFSPGSSRTLILRAC